MYYMIALLSGILIAVMLVCNGGLTAQYGIYPATAIIHIVGLIFITLQILIRGDRPLARKMPWYFYSGGAIGVATTAFNNLAYGRISVSAILALSLLGQSVASIIFDQFGLMNVTRHPFKKNKLFGLLLTCCGIAFMITEFEISAVLLSFLAGVSLVVSRTLNARLAEGTSIGSSTFFNYLIGLAVAVLVMILTSRNEPLTIRPNFSVTIYIYLGGLFGVAVVWLSNVIVSKIPAFYMTLFLFIGQVFTGLLLDTIITGFFSVRNCLAGMLVATGLAANLLLDKDNWL